MQLVVICDLCNPQHKTLAGKAAQGTFLLHAGTHCISYAHHTKTCIKCDLAQAADRSKEESPDQL